MASGGLKVARSFSSAAMLRARLGISSKTTMQAIVIEGDQARLDRARTIPEQLDDMLLIRPVSVALNPTDWRHIRGRRAKDGCIVGCDYAGIVESVGSAVTKKWKPGDKIFGVAHGANLVNPDDGAFAEVICHWRSPDENARLTKFSTSCDVGSGNRNCRAGLVSEKPQAEATQCSSIRCDKE
ncbi:hypothetical protein H9Q69_011197 [Fusarium xylarioides]|nr:hypothetical protein H9Q70_006093 [Fusarium xylarioides]KAG5781463.1 hypothetical protein H9Q73_004882 [Fusarium xylarioides]KAG5789752.1 hypothetical protein H9Q69_011197 [Fusarium xylarioides]